MPIIAEIGRKTLKGRFTMFVLYAILTVLGATMVFPFLITVSSSISDEFDYDRFSTIPRYLWSREDRFVKGIDRYFNGYADWHKQMRASFPHMPAHWNSWQEIGRDTKSVDRFAAEYLNSPPEQFARWKLMAADYSAFVDTYPVTDMLCYPTDQESSRFLKDKYEALWAAQHPDQARKAWRGEREEEALKLLTKTWGIPVVNFQTISFAAAEIHLPIWQQSYFPREYPKYLDFLRLEESMKHHGTDFAARVTPFALRAVWRKYFESEEVRNLIGLKSTEQFGIATYNRLAGTKYKSIEETPFPVPADSAEGIQKLWRQFVETRYPLRLTTLRVTPEQNTRYQDFLRERFKTVEYANRILGTHAQDWNDFAFSSTPPLGPENESVRSVWIDFAKNIPAGQHVLTSSEHAWQTFLLAKYGSLARVNETYGLKLDHIEETFPPFDAAYAVTFLQNERAFTLGPVLRNYSAVWDFISGRGNAIVVTIILILLSIGATLTINPLAAYGLSRFNIRGKDRIILYMLATMAFPAMVSAIPAYLLMRDLGLLNTFVALILPGAANGMTIFILKGFFDSLPAELYDAATIDGANEWQIFTQVTMPMMKPILAINALGAFLGAYSSWEFALITCQKQSMWTIAVWLYQANQWWAGTPWISTAGFVLVSIPTLVVFLFCQKIILRGIILPSMK